MRMKWIGFILAASFSILAHAADPALSNESFESNNLASSYYGYLYSYVIPTLGPNAVAASNWSFAGGSGLSHDATAWGGTTPEGDHFAFLQNAGGVISQSFSSSSIADYTFSFNLVQRTNHRIGGLQTLSVNLDGNTIWSGTPGTSWQTFSASLQNVGAGLHTLSFVGTNLNRAADTSVFVDNVKMSVTPVPEPETYAMLLAGLGLMGGVARRRKAARS